jgi:hypothetical protein
MSFRRFATGASLAIAGLAAAVGIGLLANSISGDSVGLGAEPLSAGETLAPATAKSDDGKSQRQRQRRRRNRGDDDSTRTTTSPDLTEDLAPADPTIDDNGGDDGSGRGRGRGGDDSGSDDSSGSGSSGSGSDDSGKIDDD